MGGLLSILGALVLGTIMDVLGSRDEDSSDGLKRSALRDEDEELTGEELDLLDAVMAQAEETDGPDTAEAEAGAEYTAPSGDSAILRDFDPEQDELVIDYSGSEPPEITVSESGGDTHVFADGVLVSVVVGQVLQAQDIMLAQT